jgi:hypothetical protein
LDLNYTEIKYTASNAVLNYGALNILNSKIVDISGMV